MSRRTERLASIIQQELGTIILHELSDPRLQGLPSITRVRVSADLGVADVFVTVMGSVGQQKAALNALQHSAGLMRTRLTRALTLKQAPFLKFHLDEGVKKEIEILDLIRKAAEESAEMERRRALAAGETPGDQTTSDESSPEGSPPAESTPPPTANEQEAKPNTP